MIIVVWRRIFHQKSDIVGLLHGLTHFNSSRHLVIISTEFWFRPANELEERHIVSLFGRCNAEPMVALGKRQWGNFTAMQQLNFRSTCKLFCVRNSFTKGGNCHIYYIISTYIHCQISQSLFNHEASYSQHADISRQGSDERIPAADQGKLV